MSSRIGIVALLGLLTLVASSIAQETGVEPLIRIARFGGGNPDVVPGGTFVTGDNSLPDNWNPFVVSDATATFRIDWFLPSLVDFNSATGQYDCFLCTSIDFSEDGLTLTYHLRRGVTWSDGMPVTADDVIFSAMLHASPDISSPSRSFLFQGDQPIEWVAVDDLTVEQRLTSPDAAVLETASWAIVPAHQFRPVFESGGAEAVKRMYTVEDPVETILSAGPFLLAEFLPGESVRFVRNPDYFGRDEMGRQLPYLDEVIVQRFPDPSGEEAAFLTGQLDILNLGSIESVIAVQEAIDSGTLDAVILPGVTTTNFVVHVTFNWQNQDPLLRRLFRDVRFRQALSHLTDRDTIIETALGGLAVPVYGTITPGNTRFFNPDAPTFPFNPERARELLAEIGFDRRNEAGLLTNAAGETIEFSVVGVTGVSLVTTVTTVLKQAFDDIGFNVTITDLPFPGPLNLTREFNEDGTRNFDAVSFAISHPPDPPLGRDVYSLNGSRHFWNMARPGASAPEEVEPFELELARLQEEGISTLDEDRRREIYNEMQVIINTNQPILTVYATQASYAYNADVCNTQDQLPDPVGGAPSRMTIDIEINLVNWLDTIGFGCGGD